MVVCVSSRQMRWHRQRVPRSSSSSSSPQTLQRSSSPSGYTSPTFHSASVTRTSGKCSEWVSLLRHALITWFMNCCFCFLNQRWLKNTTNLVRITPLKSHITDLKLMCKTDHTIRELARHSSCFVEREDLNPLTGRIWGKTNCTKPKSHLTWMSTVLILMLYWCRQCSFTVWAAHH